MYCPKIIALDMDGTLLDPSGAIPEAFWELLDVATAEGVAITPASGRQLATLRDMFAQDPPECFIAENGAVVWHKGEIVSTVAMPLEPVRTLLRELDDAPFECHPVLCAPDRSYSLRTTDPEVRAEIAKYYHANTEVDSLLDVACDTPVKLAIYVAGDAETIGYPWVAKRAPKLHHMVSGKHWIDIMHPEADKGHALAALAENLSVEIADTAAIGDFLNDYTMLQTAGRAVAKGNAHPKLKDIADEVIGTNAEHAVIDKLAEWLKGSGF